MSHPRPEDLTAPQVDAAPAPATPPLAGPLADKLTESSLGFHEAVTARSDRASRELEAVAAAELDVDERVQGWVREDLREASWWSSLRDTTVERAGALYRWFKSVALGAGACGALVWVSDGPTWLAVLFIGFSLLAAVAPEHPWEVWLLLGLTGALVTGIALLAQSIDEVSFWGAVLAVLLSAGVGLLVAVAVDSLIYRLASSVTGDLVIMLGLVVGLTAMLQSSPLEDLPAWITRGATAGLVAGIVIGLLFALTDLVSRLASKVIDALKMRRHAEAEFVQSCVWALGGLATVRVPEPDEDDPESEGTHTSEFYSAPWQRADVVAAAEYLTGVLEQHVSAALTREDRAGHAFVAREVGRRAAVLRSNKRAVLLGRPNAVEDFASTLRTAAHQGSLRSWHELPTLSADEEADAQPARGERATKLLHQAALLAIPAVLAGYGWQSQDTALLTSGAVWVGVVAVDMLSPGTRKEVTDLTGNVRNFLPGPRP